MKGRARLLWGMSRGYPELLFVTPPVRPHGGVKRDQMAALLHKLRVGLRGDYRGQWLQNSEYSAVSALLSVPASKASLKSAARAHSDQ